MVTKQLNYADLISGIATFDRSGLPQKYYIPAPGEQSILWMQSGFRALAMQFFLSQALSLSDFCSAALRNDRSVVVLVPHREGYFACLWEQEYDREEELINWLKDLDLKSLEDHLRFVSV